MKERHRARNIQKFLSGAASSMMLASAFLGAMPAEAATLLTGYVNNANISESHQVVDSVKGNGEANVVRTDSFPVDLQGAWQCVTVVVDSLVETVPVGNKVMSRVDFVRADDGRVVARFQQPGWTEAQSSVTTFSATQYQMDKTNYYYGDRAGAWAARSRDRYQLLEQNRMIAESEVDQYVDGRYVGRYRTRSTITRLDNGMRNVALQHVPDPDDQSGDRKPGF